MKSEIMLISQNLSNSIQFPKDTIMLINLAWISSKDDWSYIPGTETIESMGGKLIRLSYTKQYSTSKLVDNIEKNS